jgi:hypothetical protein
LPTKPFTLAGLVSVNLRGASSIRKPLYYSVEKLMCPVKVISFRLLNTGRTSPPEHTDHPKLRKYYRSYGKFLSNDQSIRTQITTGIISKEVLFHFVITRPLATYFVSTKIKLSKTSAAGPITFARYNRYSLYAGT